MSTYKIRNLVTALGLILVMMLSACFTPKQADQISIIETRQYQGESVVKTLQANNCSGTEEMVQDLQAINQYNHDIEITPNPGTRVNQRAVRDELRAFYRIPDGPSDGVCVIPVQIAAGEYFIYDIEWIEVWREGYFELGWPDNQEEGTYRFRQSMLCEVVAQRVEPCPSP